MGSEPNSHAAGAKITIARRKRRSIYQFLLPLLVSRLIGNLNSSGSTNSLVSEIAVLRQLRKILTSHSRLVGHYLRELRGSECPGTRTRPTHHMPNLLANCLLTGCADD